MAASWAKQSRLRQPDSPQPSPGAAGGLQPAKRSRVTDTGTALPRFPQAQRKQPQQPRRDQPQQALSAQAEQQSQPQQPEPSLQVQICNETICSVQVSAQLSWPWSTLLLP